MDATELKSTIEKYLNTTGHAIRNELNAFADWVEGDPKAKEQEKNESDAAKFLRDNGYTVTKPSDEIPVAGVQSAETPVEKPIGTDPDEKHEAS